MIRKWLLGVGVMLMAACVVEAPPSEPSSEEARVEQSITSEVNAGALTLRTNEPTTTCTPGHSRLCCPLPRCGCVGYEDCGDNGEWQGCYLWTAPGVPCP